MRMEGVTESRVQTLGWISSVVRKLPWPMDRMDRRPRKDPLRSLTGQPRPTSDWS